MTRTVKKPEVRRKEIIFAAEKLFEKYGYTKTSVEAIIKDVGVAKGTFYYYFKTKQDILRALVEQIGAEIEALFNSIVERNDLTAVKKLQLMIRGPEKEAKTTSSVMKIIHKPENRELQESLNIQTVKIIAPLIAKVLEQGNKEGIFRTSAPVETIQIVLAGSQFVLDSGLFKWTAKKRVVFLESIQMMFEQIVGVKPGTLSFISKE